MTIEEIILIKRPDLKGTDDKLNQTEFNRLILSKDKEIKQILKQESMFLDEDKDFDWELVKSYFFRKEHIKGSFTKYENKTGLAINEIGDVVLNFPYKDCVFVGGMDKEDSSIGAECFYNEIIDKEKIFQMFAPKAFDNIKKISVSKEEVIEHQVKSFFEEEKLKENLLIKGNNLLCLHSLKVKMKNKIDVIYIDPPYYFNETKASDTFAYNSNFKLSTWLVFMKNRLEIAKELLSDTGVIFISMNDTANSYLKLLCDEIFGVNHFIGNIHWNKGYGKNDSKLLRDVTENILCFSKNKNSLTNFSTEKNGYTEINNIKLEFLEELKFKNIVNPENELQNRIRKHYKDNPELKGISSYDKVEEKTFKIYRGVTLEDPKGSNYYYDIIHPNGKACKIPTKGWNRPEFNSEGSMDKLLENNEIIFGKDETTLPNRKYYLDNMSEETPSNFIYNSQQGGTELKEIMNKLFFSFPKHTSLIKYLVNFIENKNVIVLDFFAGSGTTGHAVMDLNKEDGGNRKFILLEQMDYIENITKERLIRAIQKNEYNEDFVYMELKENINKKVKDDIKSVSTIQELKNIIESSFDFGIFTNVLILKDDLIKEIENLDIKSAKRLILEKYIDNTNDYVQYHNYTVLDDNEKFYN